MGKIEVKEFSGKVEDHDSWSEQFLSSLHINKDAKSAYNAIMGNGSPVDHSLGLSYIKVALSKPVLHEFLDKKFTNAKEGFEWLKERFGCATAVQTWQFACTIFTPFSGDFKQFNAQKYCSEKIDAYRSYNENVKPHQKISERFACDAILFGLPSQYKTFVSSVQLMSTDLEMRPLCDKIISEEALLKMQHVTLNNEQNAALSVFDRLGNNLNGNGFVNPGKRPNGGGGHAGWRPNKFRRSGGGGGRGGGGHGGGGRGNGGYGNGGYGNGGGDGNRDNRKCFECGEKGHMSYDCEAPEEQRREYKAKRAAKSAAKKRHPKYAAGITVAARM